MNNADVQAGRINNQLATQLEELSGQMDQTLTQTHRAWRDWRNSVEARTRPLDTYAREHPWALIAGGLVLGLAIGLVCSWDDR